MSKTVGEVAFSETKARWEQQEIPERRHLLRELAEDEILAEYPFVQLPARTRDSLILHWEREVFERGRW